ncbi:hypothetical protein HMPREF1872_00349, partial [Amygdalobacter nucleatus]
KSYLQRFIHTLKSIKDYYAEQNDQYDFSRSEGIKNYIADMLSAY